MKNTDKLSATVALALALSACGGSSGDSNGPPVAANPAPQQPPVIAPVQPVATIDNSDRTSTYTGEQLSQFNWVNKQRAQCGLGTLAQNAALDTSAGNHFEYLKQNFAAGRADQLHAISIHNESSDLPGFTGKEFFDRMAYAHYAGNPGTELIGGATSLSGATFHALGLMMAGHKEIGFKYGQVPRPDVGPNSIETWGVFNLGYAGEKQEPLSSTVLTYPCEGSVLALPYHGGESPDPFAGTSKDPWEASPAIMARVRSGQTLEVTSWTVVKKDTQDAIPHFKIFTNADTIYVSKNMAALILDQKLTSGASYTATLVGKNNGQPFSTTYTFSVQ